PAGHQHRHRRSADPRPGARRPGLAHHPEPLTVPAADLPSSFAPAKGLFVLPVTRRFGAQTERTGPALSAAGMEKEQPIASTRPPVKRPGRASHRFLLERTPPDAAAPPCSKGTGR